jgi:hypothetical protein
VAVAELCALKQLASCPIYEREKEFCNVVARVAVALRRTEDEDPELIVEVSPPSVKKAKTQTEQAKEIFAGQMVGVTSLMVDVTQRKKAEFEQEQARVEKVTAHMAVVSFSSF